MWYHTVIGTFGGALRGITEDDGYLVMDENGAVRLSEWRTRGTVWSEWRDQTGRVFKKSRAIPKKERRFCSDEWDGEACEASGDHVPGCPLFVCL